MLAEWRAAVDHAMAEEPPCDAPLSDAWKLAEALRLQLIEAYERAYAQ
jgi:hypothetical protein